eukprot:3930763-Rhodomonas_salina.2
MCLRVLDANYMGSNIPSVHMPSQKRLDLRAPGPVTTARISGLLSDHPLLTTLPIHAHSIPSPLQSLAPRLNSAPLSCPLTAARFPSPPLPPPSPSSRLCGRETDRLCVCVYARCSMHVCVRENPLQAPPPAPPLPSSATPFSLLLKARCPFTSSFLSNV